MKRLHRINNKRFTIRLCFVAKKYGFKTVGKFYDFLIGLESPNVKLYHGTTHVRAIRLIRELQEYLQ